MFDRGMKLPLYARAGLREFWLVDVNAGRIDVHRSPSGDRYVDIVRVERGGVVAPEAFPDLVLPVDAILA